jgi:hypothetical protein
MTFYFDYFSSVENSQTSNGTNCSNSTDKNGNTKVSPIVNLDDPLLVTWETSGEGKKIPGEKLFLMTNQ